MAGTPEQHIWILRNQLNESKAAVAEEERKNGEVKKDNEQLKTLIGKLRVDVSKLTVHAKNCEKATGKAQKEAKHAKGNADHLVNSQKGQLKNAERRYEAAARDLKQWTEKYGLSVNQPAEEKNALQLSVSEWQSKAEKARNEIASLEAQIEGTPEQIGLHQALEEWEEHQGCSAGFAELEDKLHDGKLRQQKLESDLTASRQRHQKAKSDLQALQTKAEQLEQANMAMQNGNNVYGYVQRIQQLESDLQTSTERGRKTELDMKALQEITIQLQQANKTFDDQTKTDVDMLDDDMVEKQKLESNLRAFQERYQETESSMKILQEKADQLERANKGFQDQDELRKNMLHKLESDLEASKLQCEETNSNMGTLQDNADQLEVDLRTTIEQHQTTKSNMEALQEKAEQLEVDLRNTKEQYATTKSNMTAVQGEADRLELDLETTKEQYQTTVSDMEALQGKVDQLESDLESTREQYQTTKSDMEALQGKTDQLEQANKSLQKENERLQAKAFEKREQDDKANNEIADAVQRDEERMRLMDQENHSKKLEQDSKAQHLRTKMPIEAERSQVTPPSSPIVTTDEGSQDRQKTPRPGVSLRQDLGYSSRDQSDRERVDEKQSNVEQSNAYTAQQKGAESSTQAEAGEEKKKVTAETWKKSDSEDGEKLSKGDMRWENKKQISVDHKASLPPPIYRQEHQRRPKKLDPREVRAKDRTKEQSEVIETLFECSLAKANAIDRRLKALGPGCRLYEAPALVAYELSGIPEDTYKGLASGQLIATMPPNEIKDAGANPDHFANDVATDTTDLPIKEAEDPQFIMKDMATGTEDLPAEKVAGPVFIARNMTTETTDLPVLEAPALDNNFGLWGLYPYFLMSLMIFIGLFCLYVGLKANPIPNTYQIIYKSVFSHRHVPFPTPSLNASPSVTFVYPPTPVPRLGFLKMMNGSSLGGPLEGRKW